VQHFRYTALGRQRCGVWRRTYPKHSQFLRVRLPRARQRQMPTQRYTHRDWHSDRFGHWHRQRSQRRLRALLQDMQVVRMALRVIGRVLSLVAIAGITFLSNRKKVDPARAGLVGSSQAGWVAAQAIRHAARPADVFLLECRRDSNDGCRAKFVQY
jgi:hypothetical protein